MSRARRHVISVSLFPFLAVLICIMGALVIILVLMVARVGDGAAHVATATSSEDPSNDRRELRERIEDAQWKRTLLEQNRVEKQQELADKRAELAHLEDHIQRLQEQAKVLLQRAGAIDEGQQLRAADLDQARQEIGRLKQEAAKKEQNLAEKRKKQSSEEQWYALIPYDGPSGTRRRPIYLECTEIGITLQPEGLTFRAEDFQGPLGPGNPLDAALRTLRDRLALGGGKAGEPYPLLVVRPGGIVAYAAARAALKSWDDEFGYELIGDDKRLDFGQPDLAASAAIEKTIVAARRRQALLAAAMPRQFAGKDALNSFAEETGSGRGGGTGFGENGGRSVAGGGLYGGGYGGNPIAGTGGAAANIGMGNGTGSSGSPGGIGTLRHAASPEPGASGFPPPATAAIGSGLSSSGPENPSGSSAASGGGYPSGSSGSGTSAGGYAGSGKAAAGYRGGGAANRRPATAGAPATGGGASSTGGTGGTALGMGGEPGSQGQSGMSVPVPNLGFDASKAGSQSSSAKAGQSAGNAEGSGGSSNRPAGKSADGGNKSKSKSRRPNWAVPNARVSSIGVTRPIHVAVLADRLVIVPEKGEDRRPEQFPISPRLAPPEVDAFVSAVQQEMKSWGLAVQNGYWRPQIVMDVAPDAEEQCRDLQIALEGSGFEMQRKLR